MRSVHTSGKQRKKKSKINFGFPHLDLTYRLLGSHLKKNPKLRGMKGLFNPMKQSQRMAKCHNNKYSPAGRPHQPASRVLLQNSFYAKRAHNPYECTIHQYSRMHVRKKKTTVRLPDSYHSFYPGHPFSHFSF